MANIKTQENRIYRGRGKESGRGLMLQQTSNCCCRGEGKREGVDSVEVVREVPTRRRSRRTVEEEVQRRRLQSVVVVAEASPYTGVASTTGWKARFLGTATAWMRLRWRQSGRRWWGPTSSGGGQGGSGLEERVRKFGSLSASSPNP
jgi:hypothetical protein